MTGIEIRVDEFTTPEICDQIIGGLVFFNDAAAGLANHRSLTVVALQEGEAIGGLLGYTNWEWLYVAQLWVSETLRGHGVGGQLVRAAESEARRRGCRHAHVDTFSFQARPFYERLGYTVFGQLDDYAAGHTRYFLQKRDIAREEE